MHDSLVSLLQTILSDLGVHDIVPEIQAPEDPSHGEYTTNVAMRLAKVLKKSPMHIAKELQENIIRAQKISAAGIIERVEVAPPGFINIFLTEASLINQLNQVLKQGESFGQAQQAKPDELSAMSFPLSAEGKKRNKNLKRKKTDSLSNHGEIPQKNSRGKTAKRYMVEFAHPNTHKAFHIGHLRNITTGESIVRLLQSQGAEVIRVNYQGDVGMHIAKALYALMDLSAISDQLSAVRKKDIKSKVEFLGKAYAAGSKAFEDPPAGGQSAQAVIKDFNALIYASAQRFARQTGIQPGMTDYLQFVKGNASRLDEVYALWKETRQWSLDYFDDIYARVYTHYDRFYFESQCLAGVDAASDAVTKGILKRSEGAIIFDGKPHGIDTRVFVNNLGLPTYEAKELALAKQEMADFGTIDRLIHVVGPEQASFFIVTFKAEELLGLVKPGVQYHLAYGWVRLKHGKMSSRLGNVVLGEWLIDEAKKSIYTILDKSVSLLKVQPFKALDKERIAEAAAIAAIKYSFLRVGVASEIAFDVETSVSFDGDSGPYLQYTYARARSVLRRAGSISASTQKNTDAATPRHRDASLNPEERALARLINYFPEIVAQAASQLAPNVLCTYLFRLAQAFNVFYAKHSILGEASARQRISASTQKNTDAATPRRRDAVGLRLALTAASAQVLSNGLYLLGIEVLEQM